MYLFKLKAKDFKCKALLISIKDNCLKYCKLLHGKWIMGYSLWYKSDINNFL